MVLVVAPVGEIAQQADQRVTGVPLCRLSRELWFGEVARVPLAGRKATGYESKPRRHRSVEEKVKVVRLHLCWRGSASTSCASRTSSIPARFGGGNASSSSMAPGPSRARLFAAAIAGREDRAEGLAAPLAAPTRGALRTGGRAHPRRKRPSESMSATWAPHDIRDQVVDFVRG